MYNEFTIKGIKKYKIPEKSYYIFDSETKLKNNKHIVRLIIMFKVIEGKIIEQLEFSTKRDFTRFLLSHHISKQTIIWAHNTNFDVRTSLDFSELYNKQYKINCFSLNPFIFVISNDYYKYKFLDTMSFFRTSIEKLGQYFNIKKIHIKDFNKIDYDTLKARCFNDVLVTSKVLDKLYNMFINKISVSSPNLSYQTFKTYLKYPIEKLNSDLIEKSYYGGRVELFNKNKEFCRRYDINSMYPYVMKKFLYPTKLIMREKNPSIPKVKRLINDNIGIIANVNCLIPKIQIAPFPFKRDEDSKLIFPVGKFNTNITSSEFDFNYITSINEIECFKMEDLFSNFVDDFYFKKLNSSGLEKDFYKLILNSLYGKFAQKRKLTKFYGYSDKEFTENIEIVIDKKINILRCLNGILFLSFDKERNISTAISCFITSNARNYLYTKFLKPYEENVMYCDTDSITVKNIFLNCDFKLGGLKLEKEGFAKFYAPKSYEFEEEHKFKGIPKNWKYKIIDGKLISKGIKFSGFYENIRRFNDIGVSQIQMTKTLSLIDNKRMWLGSGLSYPIILK